MIVFAVFSYFLNGKTLTGTQIFGLHLKRLEVVKNIPPLLIILTECFVHYRHVKLKLWLWLEDMERWFALPI
jgi:hypothetical protein